MSRLLVASMYLPLMFWEMIVQLVAFELTGITPASVRRWSCIVSDGLSSILLQLMTTVIQWELLTCTGRIIEE